MIQDSRMFKPGKIFGTTNSLLSCVCLHVCNLTTHVMIIIMTDTGLVSIFRTHRHLSNCHALPATAYKVNFIELDTFHLDPQIFIENYGDHGNSNKVGKLPIIEFSK